MKSDRRLAMESLHRIGIYKKDIPHIWQGMIEAEQKTFLFACLRFNYNLRELIKTILFGDKK